MSDFSDFVSKSAIEFVKDGKFIELSLCDDSSETVRLITKWRGDNIKWYDSDFLPTEFRTKKWLQNNILNCADSVLFLILVDGKKIGHIGLDNYNPDLDSIYIVSVVKGESIVFPGLMEHVGNKLIDWIFHKLNISTIKLRVFSDNYKAINMNERMGMLTINSVPMIKKRTFDGFVWEKCDFSYDNNLHIIRYMNDMEIKKSNRKVLG